MITSSLEMITLMKHILRRQRGDKQMIKFSPIQMNLGGIDMGLIVEVIFLLLHPNLLTKGVRLCFKEPIYEQYTSMELN